MLIKKENDVGKNICKIQISPISYRKTRGGSKTRKSENTEAQNGYLKDHILKSTQPRIKF
jgi:hypothetical protein